MELLARDRVGTSEWERELALWSVIAVGAVC